MNGKWLPAKAFGTGNVSSGESSFWMSSKFFVSASPSSSGMTGGTAEKHQQHAVLSTLQ